MNREKTVIVPARKLTEKEENACRSEWKKIKMSYKERLLGIFIGLNATIWDQYSIPIEKFEKAIEIVDEVRKNMSLACRITIANVFLIPLLQYPNRHFFMPQKLLQQVTGLLLNFLTRTKICKLGIFTHVKKNIRDQNRTTRREARERRITPFYLHHQRIKLPHDKYRSERKSNRGRNDKTNPRVGSGVWLLQRSNKARSPGHVQRENTEQTRADWRRDRKPVRNKTPAHHEVALPNAANK